MEAAGTAGDVRAAELVGALSLATDLGTGQPLEHALRTAVLSARLGELAGTSAEELSDTYYVALLHASGCTSNEHEAAQLVGDDIEHRAAFFLIDPTDREEVLAFYRAHVLPDRPPEVRAQMVERALADPTRAREAFAAMCEVAQRFAGWLGLGLGVENALEFVFARWDGRGLPAVAGEEIPLPARLLHVARDFSLFVSAAGAEEARGVVERRAGAAYEPKLAELAAQHLGDVDLDPDRRAVGGAGGPVGAALERSDVTERAAVDTAHVGVERPLERHPRDAVQRRAARLDPVRGSHLRQYRTYVRLPGRGPVTRIRSP